MKKFLLMVLAMVLVLMLIGCDTTPTETPSGNEAESVVNEPIENDPPEVSEDAEDSSILEEVADALLGSYEDILSEYSQKLQDATPILIEEYNEAAKDNQDGLTGLAVLCNEKISELAVISNEGIQQMATLYLKHGSGSQEEYTEWAGKLQAVYMEEAAKIQEAYTESAR